MSDSFSRMIYHRNITAADSPLLTLAEVARLVALKKRTNQINCLLADFNARNVLFTLYGLGNDGGTFDLTIIGLPPKLDKSPEYVVASGPRIRRLAKIACTLGASTETNLDPFTGSANTGTWRAVDTMAVLIAGTGIVLRDESGNDGCSGAILDPLACPHMFAYADNFTNVTRVIVGAQFITRFNAIK